MNRSRRRSSKSDADAIDSKKSKTDNIFISLLEKSGFNLSDGLKPNILDVDESSFRKKFKESILKHSNYPLVLKEILSNFQAAIQNIDVFKVSLAPTKSSLESSRNECLDSLVKMLLRVDCLQENLSNLLLERIAEISLDIDSSNVELPRLVMSQFCWLEYLVNSKELVNKMLEIISVTPVSVQREIIACLPEIINDDDHDEVATHLSTLMSENNELTIIILDTLSNLTLSVELLHEVRSRILKTLPSIEHDHLPISVKFVLQTLEASSSFEVLHDLRSNLDFQSTFTSVISSTPFGSGVKKSHEKEVELLVLDVIKSCIKFKKHVADSWIKVIESITSNSDQKVIDFYLIFILHSFSARKKAVEILLKNKVKNGCFDEILLQGAFGSHPNVIAEYFPSILRFAEVLLHSSEKEVSYFGSVMFVLTFKAANTYGRQEVVASLINHIGSGIPSEVNQALNVLSNLAKKYPTDLGKFTIFIKSTLDYIDNLSLSQIRKIYNVLCLLAYTGTTKNVSMQDDLNILIRKQLSNPIHKYKRMGIIGALKSVKTLTLSDEELSLSESSLSSDICQDAVRLLEMIKSSTRNCPEALALFYDELADTMVDKNLDSKLEAWTSESVASDFQDDFVVDVNPDKKLECIEGIPLTLKLGHDPVQEGSIALNLLPVLVKSKMDVLRSNQSYGSQFSKTSSPITMNSQFRLFQICEYLTENGKMDGIDALLGCPIYLPDFEDSQFAAFSSTKQHIICDSHFYAVNWMRELVNAFVGQTENTMKQKVFKRLEDIEDMQHKLQKLLQCVRNYQPPQASFDAKQNSDKVFTSFKPAKKKATKKSAKKRTSDESNLENTVATPIPTSSSSICQDNQEHFNPVSIEDIQPFLREFDLKVHNILRNTDVLTSNNEEDEISLGVSGTCLLLEDLSRKLNNCIESKSTHRNNFGFNNASNNEQHLHVSLRNPELVVDNVVKLLPSLCQHLEATIMHFQECKETTNDCTDVNLSFSENGDHNMNTVMERTLSIISSTIHWNGYYLRDNRNLLKRTLMVFVRRIEPDFTFGNLKTLIMKSCSYLLNYAESISNFKCALSLVKILESMHELNEKKPESGELLAKSCQQFLKRKWVNPEGTTMKGSSFNAQIQYLLSTFFKHSPKIISLLESFVTGPIAELIEKDNKSAFSTSYPTLTRSTFSVYYRLMIQHLVIGIKEVSQRISVDSSNKEKLSHWILAVRVFHILVHLIKVFDTRSNLLSCLKNSRFFIDIFIKHGVPLLEQLFGSQQEDVINLLKNLQLSTRFLHHICSHSKVCKDVTLTNQVPFVKKSLEAFLFRVKAMLAANKCIDAFWLGNLKNRDLQGEEIVSETSVVESESDTDAVPEQDEEDAIESEPEKGSTRVSNSSDLDNDSSSEAYSDIF